MTDATTMTIKIPPSNYCPSCSYPGYTPVLACLACGTLSVKSRTQKGRGLEVLSNEFSGEALRLLGIIQTVDQASSLSSDSYAKFPMFARPAPSMPRHGYIDSRIVNNVDEVVDLIKVVLADDPLGEILLCNFINTKYNAIWTPGSITVGPGHDGATSGKDTIYVPLVPNDLISKGTLKAAGIAGDKWPYLEVVYPVGGLDGIPIYTQLREGPVMKSMGNFVPIATKVKRVIHADPSKYADLGWEKEINKAKNEPGIVVWHPNGSLTDHFSIHSFTAGIPIIFDKDAPTIGSILEPTVDGPVSFSPEAMLRGFVAGSKIPLQYSNRTSIKAALVALHNSIVLTGENSKWLGFSAAVLLRFGMAALNGEIRHFKNDNNSKPSREAIYEESLTKSLSFHKAHVKRLVNLFRYGKWHSAGFGGPKWACCGAATIDVFNAVYNLAKNPTEENAITLIQALNLMVNQAHNGGWWFNKFVSQNTFKEAAAGNLHLIVECGPTFYQAGLLADKMKTSMMDSHIERIAKWGCITLSPPKASSAKILYHPDINALEITVSARLLGSKFKPLRASITKLSVSDIKMLKNNLYLVEGDDGYRLELRKENPVIIWQDESLREKSIEMSKVAMKN